MKELFELYFIFMQMGAVLFGGGYAMLPMLTRELVDKRGWATDNELNDYFAIGQVTPGVIAVNVATFIGNKRKGIIGGIVATTGLVTVPFIIITIIAAVLTNFADIEIVKHAFNGIRVCVCVLIFNAVVRLWKNSVTDVASFIIFLLIFLLSAFGDLLPLPFSISPVFLVIGAAVAGIIIKCVREAKKTEGGENGK